MTTPATPEQFLREFALEVIEHFVDADDEAYKKTLKGWAKLLELREDAAELQGRLKEMQLMHKGWPNSVSWPDYVKHRIDEIMDELTTPNNNN